MANNTIKGLTVEIGGDTTKLGKALEDVNKKSGDLSQELGDINRLLKLDPGNTELLAQKQKVLTEAISNTSEKLETLKEAEKQVQQQFERGEVSEEQYRALQREIIATQNKLDGYGGALQETEEAQKKAAKGVEDFGDESDKAGDKALTLGDIIKGNLISDAIKSGISALASGFKAVGDSIGTAISAGAEYADTILTLSAQTGLSTDTLEKYNAVAELTDVSLDTLTGSMAKNVKSMASGKDAYDKLGVAVKDSNGELRDSETVYWEAIDALGKIDNETERDALSMEIFGKSARDLNTIIEMGSEGVAEYTTMAEDMGAVLGGEGLEALGRLDDQFQIFKSTTASTGNILASAFAPQLEGMVRGVNNVAGSFNGLIAAVISGGDVNGAMESVSSSVNTMITTISYQLPQLVTVAENLVEAVINVVVTALPDILQQGTILINSIVDLVITGLGDLIPALLEQLPVLLESLLLIIENVITALSGALPGIITAIVAVIPQLINTLVSHIPDLLQAAITLLMAIVDALPTIITELINALPGIIETVINALLEAIPMLLDAGIQLFMAIINALPVIIQALVENLPTIINTIINGLLQALPLLLQAAIQLLMAIIQALPVIIQLLVRDLPKITSTITTTLINNLPLLIKAAVQLFMGIIKAIPQIVVELVKQLPTIISTIVKVLADGIGDVAKVGLQLVQGLWKGISDAASWVLDKIKGFGKSILNGIKGIFGIKSPSKEMAWVGKMLDEGLAEGVEKYADEPLEAMADLSEGILGEAEGINGISLERQLQTSTSTAAAASDNGLLGKLDRILNAIEAGKVLTIDGDTLVGATASKYDNALGQRRLLAARGAI